MHPIPVRLNPIRLFARWKSKIQKFGMAGRLTNDLKPISHDYSYFPVYSFPFSQIDFSILIISPVLKWTMRRSGRSICKACCRGSYAACHKAEDKVEIMLLFSFLSNCKEGCFCFWRCIRRFRWIGMKSCRRTVPWRF